MRFVREHWLLLLALAVLVAGTVFLVHRQTSGHSRHVELREAFILLHTRGYKDQADRLYHRLIRDVPTLSGRELLDDFQRTLLLVDPAQHQPDNPLWKYHWYVSNELERRSEKTLQRALELAGEE